MTGIGMSGVVKLSLARTKEVLFAPFSAGKWARLLLIALLSGGFGFNGVGLRRVLQPSGKAAAPAPGAEAPAAPGAGAAAGAGASSRAAPSPAAVAAGARALAGKARGWALSHKALLSAAALILVLFGIFILWLRARFAFVWLNAVRENTGAVSTPFDESARPGDSLFRFSLGMSVVSLSCLSAAGAWAWRAARSAGAFGPDFAWSWGAAAGLFGPPAAALAAVWVVLLVLNFTVDQFVVPIMGADHSRFGEALGKWRAAAKGRAAGVLAYVLWWAGLKVLAAVAVVVAVAAVALAGALSGLLVFGAAYLALVKWLGLKLLFVAVAVALGVPFGVFLIALLLAAQLPPAVFFRSLSLYFISSLDAGYALLPLQRGAPDTPGWPGR